jgi:hypothetical protein
MVENVSPLAVTFKNQFALDCAFLAAGIYLRFHPDPETDGQATKISERKSQATQLIAI